MNKSGVALDAAIPTRDHTLERIEPCKRPFDLPSSLVATQHPAILCGRFLAIAFVGRNQHDAALCQPLIEWITVVGTIPHKSFGSSHGDGCIDGSFDKGDFMWASRSRVHGEWKTMSVSNDHELRTLAPLGLSNFRPPFFATTNVPSIKHSDKSIWPACSRWRASVSSIVRITPALTQRLNRRKQVQPEGNLSGKSAQPAPVRSTHKIPFNTARSSCTIGLPRPSLRRTGAGIRGARIAHCSSVSSSLRAMMQPLHAKKNIDCLFMK